MKRPTIGNDNMVSLYSGRSYLTPTSKSPLTSYQKSLGLTYNSPKGESKGFAFPQKPFSTNLKLSPKPGKNESLLERRNSKGDTDSYSKTIGNSAYNVTGPASRPSKPRGSSTKGSVYDKAASPKMYNGLKYSEALNGRDSSAKQLRTQGLEIDTEIQTFNTTGGLKAYSTKNKDSKDRMQTSVNGIANTNSSLDYAKYTNLANQTVSGTMRYEYLRTEPVDDKYSASSATKPKNVLSRILSNTSDKGYSPKPMKKSAYDSNAASSADNSLQINNFFSSAKRKEIENSISKKEANLSVSTKVEKGKEESARSSDLRKRVSPKTSQLELRSSKGFNAANEQRNEDANQEQESKTPKSAQKTSLNSFITKVDKGMALPINKGRKEEETQESNANNPYMVGARTTANSDNKTITFSKNKLNQQALASSQDSSKSRMRQSGGLSATKESFRNGQGESSSPTKEDAFVYYMTSLQKHHRNWNESDYFCQIFKEHFIQTFQALTFCKYLRPVDPKMIAQKKVFLPKKACYKDKKTIIFDLDETLIHCNESADIPSDVILPIKFPHGEIIEAGINIRPYAVEILKEISQDFEIIIFTASHSCYANVVLDYLDPQQQYIQHRLYRENCVVTDEGIYIKDLRILGNRSLQDSVLVDNAAYSFGYQIENGIPCAPYYDNKEDRELKHLIPYLKSLQHVKDVREVNKQTFRLQSYTQYDTLDKVLNKVVLTN